MANKRPLFVRSAGLIGAVVVALCTLPGDAAAGGGTYDFVFTGVATGTVTYAAHDDVTPTAISLSYGTCSWDIYTQDIGAYAATWVGDSPVAIGNVGHNSGGVRFDFFSSNGYFIEDSVSDVCGLGSPWAESGTYSITSHAHTAVPAFAPIGLMALVALMGVAGIQKLRA